MCHVRVFVGTRPILIVGDDYYEVDIYIPGEKLTKGVGYIQNDTVYIYRGKLKDKDDIEGGIYNDDGEYVFIEYKKTERSLYHINNVTELNPESIFDSVEKNKDTFIQPEDIEIINNNTELYTPTIKEEDDFLKYLVKKIIIDKKINLRNYKNKFATEYSLNNMKSGLNRQTKMTVTNFKLWCEILGVKWEMVVSDSGEDPINPLPNAISINSNEF